MRLHKADNLAKFNDHFVCQKIPFVGCDFPIIDTSVVEKIPFVSYRFRSKFGFTLIELVVTLAVVAIVVGFAVPAMRDIILNNRLATQANDLISDVAVARSSAIKHNSNVVMCAAPTAASCGGGGWNNGRLIFVDSPPFNFALDANEIVIRFHEPFSGSVESGPGTSFPDPIVFNSRGIPLDNTGQRIGVQQFVLCDTERQVNGRFLTLTANGQLSVTVTQPCP